MIWKKTRKKEKYRSHAFRELTILWLSMLVLVKRVPKGTHMMALVGGRII
jgi:hypothetical protein